MSDLKFSGVLILFSNRSYASEQLGLAFCKINEVVKRHKLIYFRLELARRCFMNKLVRSLGTQFISIILFVCDLRFVVKNFLQIVNVEIDKQLHLER